jgi:hypothetical protein
VVPRAAQEEELNVVSAQTPQTSVAAIQSAMTPVAGTPPVASLPAEQSATVVPRAAQEEELNIVSAQTPQTPVAAIQSVMTPPTVNNFVSERQETAGAISDSVISASDRVPPTSNVVLKQRQNSVSLPGGENKQNSFKEIAYEEGEYVKKLVDLIEASLKNPLIDDSASTPPSTSSDDEIPSAQEAIPIIDKRLPFKGDVTSPIETAHTMFGVPDSSDNLSLYLTPRK